MAMCYGVVGYMPKLRAIPVCINAVLLGASYYPERLKIDLAASLHVAMEELKSLNYWKADKLRLASWSLIVGILLAVCGLVY